jgi:hypothetical protein
MDIEIEIPPKTKPDFYEFEHSESAAKTNAELSLLRTQPDSISPLQMSPWQRSRRIASQIWTNLAGSAVGARAINWYRSRTPRDTRIAVIVSMSVIFLAFIGGRSFVAALQPNEKRVLTQWLDAQLAGGTGSEFAADGPQGVRIYFHAIRNWRILDNPKPGEYIVEIGSATPTGAMTTGECHVVVAHSRNASSQQSSLKVVQVDFDTTRSSGT